MDMSKLITAEQKAERTLIAARTAALATMNQWVEAVTQPLTSGVTQQEIASYGAKEAAAIAVKAGTATPGQMAMIQTEAALTGENIGALCDTIIAKANVYNPAVGMIAGLRRRVEAALPAATTAEECEDIVSTAIADAQSLMGQ